MNFGYKTFIALTLATAACFRTKAQGAGMEKTNALTEVAHDNKPAIEPDTATISDGVQLPNQDKTLTAGATDSTEIEEIYQSVLEIEHDVVRFIAHFESLKMNAYWDKTAKKWTIGFGNTTHPDGRPIRRGDQIKDEEELMHYFRSYFKERVAPTIKEYFPGWKELSKNEKIAMLDLFWNAGSGRGVLSTSKEYDTAFQNLSEPQRQEVADLLKNQNTAIQYGGQNYTLRDLPEWRNLNISERMALTPVYQNSNIMKGYEFNTSYSERWRRLNEEQRQEVSGLLSSMESRKNPQLKVSDLSSLSAGMFTGVLASGYNISVPSLNYQQINDSTLRYQSFLTTDDYTMSDVPLWYRAGNKQRLDVCKLLAQNNKAVTYRNHSYEAKGISLWYFLEPQDRDSLQTLFAGHEEVLTRTAKDKKNKPVLSNLGYEVNAYAMNKSPSFRERVAMRIASYIHSGGNVVEALQKRANIRAQVFLGEITLDGSGPNSIDLEKVSIGAGYSVKIGDLTNPKLICDSINNCNYGKNFKDTVQYQLAHAGRGAVIKRNGSRGR